MIRPPLATHVSVTLLLPLLLLLTASGCYTSLTKANSVHSYLTPAGEIKKEFPDVERVGQFILAPDYNELLKSLENSSLSQYRLTPGTLVSVEIYGHNIVQQVTIRPDGMVDLPLVGEITATGSTIKEFKQTVSERYADFFVDAPQVILNTNISTNDASASIGEASVINLDGFQGVFELTGDEYVTQALASVRTLGNDSEWNEVAIIRRSLSDRQSSFVIICDIEKLVEYGDVGQDILLRNGDVIYVPKEQNTLLEEITANIAVLAAVFGDIESSIDLIERIEDF